MAPVNGWPAGGSEGREHPLMHYLEPALGAASRPDTGQRHAEPGRRNAPAGRSALALAEKGTRLADTRHGVSDQTRAQVPKHYDDDQIAALVCLVALINTASRLAVIVHQQGGSYEPGMFAATFN